MAHRAGVDFGAFWVPLLSGQTVSTDFVFQAGRSGASPPAQLTDMHNYGR